VLVNLQKFWRRQEARLLDLLSRRRITQPLFDAYVWSALFCVRIGDYVRGGPPE